jgi:MOSC domain-containing protein YiiM
MRIQSINAGQAETIEHDGKTFVTGICKNPLQGPVRIGQEGVADDAILATEHHGGADQAVYAYSVEDYEWWAEQTGLEFFPGVFGENLTISDMPSNMHIGDRLLIGELVLEATAPRIPCATLAARMGDPGFGMAFRKAEKPGIYFRVLNAGDVSVGDPVTFVGSEETNVSVLDLFRFYYALTHDPKDLRRFLEAPIAKRFRARIETRLAAQ